MDSRWLFSARLGLDVRAKKETRKRSCRCAKTSTEETVMLPQVYPILRDDPEVAALINGRVYRHGSAPHNVTAPYVTWFVVTGLPENSIAELPRADRYEVQVDCWSVNTGTGSRGIETLAQAVRDAIEPFAHMTAMNVDERDEDTQRYRISMQFTFWKIREQLS